MPTEGDTLNGDIPHQSQSFARNEVEKDRSDKAISIRDHHPKSETPPTQSNRHHYHRDHNQEVEEEQKRYRRRREEEAREHERVRANQHSCPHCGLLINSAESLHVHMQYQHEDMNRWGVSGSVQSSTASTTSSGATTTTTTSSSSSTITTNKNSSSSGTNSPTDSENNNQPIIGRKLNESPQFLTPTPTDKTSLNSLSNAPISAAADSSDNQQPTTPQSTGPIIGSAGNVSTGLEAYNNNSGPYQTASGLPLLAQDMHPYPTYMHGYEQYYHPPPGMDYAAAQSAALYASNATSQGPPGNQEYKVVPSSRYHPYMNNSSSLHHQQHQQQQHTTNGSASNNASSNASNSSLSPRVVSSSSPTQNAILGQDSISSMQADQVGQTGGGGPKVCDKCGLVCQTQGQLSEHYSAAHGTQPPNDSAINRSGDEQTLQTQYSTYQPYIKEEPPSDILDLDSQKMVYPPQHDGIGQEPLPPMHSMHPMHRSLMWGAPEIHSGYMPHCQPDMKPYYSPLKQNYPTIKQEYSSGPAGFPAQNIKSEFVVHHQSSVPLQTREVKPFNTELASGGNPVTTSPSEFPSTTTPQENGGQFRGFEPPTSSLPSNTGSTKSATWKSNEARRPKTYNCTACNKWFTSSGHLKRHYNTTLHKNAVKSSGQPDPATLPISVHHHPTRDPNSKHHHRNNSQSNQPPPAPPEPPRSPEYQPQYTPPPNSFSQPPQGFQQYTTLQSSANGHPNGQAGPSVRASQQRGLLIISNTAVTSNLEEQEVQHLQHQPEEAYISLEQAAQHQILQAAAAAAQAAEEEEEELQQVNNNTSSSLELHRSHQHLQDRQQQQQQVHIISMSPQQIQQHMLRQQQLEEQQHIISTMDTTPTTTTTIINTMDQQFIITSPLAINTNITQSYQHLQPPEEHQLSYHTTTGNEDDVIDMTEPNSPNSMLLQQLSAYGIQTEPSPQSDIVTVQRLPNGGGLVTYQENMSLPYTPIVPESYLYATQVKCERSPEVGDVAPEISPYSPTITSTKAALPSPAAIGGHKRTSSGLTAKTPLAKRRKVQQDKKTLMSTTSTPLGSSLAANTNGVATNINDVSTTTMTTTTTTTGRSLGSPTGEIRCDECNKVFTKICYLTQHNKTFHNGEQPFRCNRCGKRFSNEKIYDTHFAKHSALQKPHRCQFCPKQFHHKTDLRRHLDSHTGRKAYVCETCSKGFTRRDHLRKHGDTHKPKPPKPIKIRTKLVT